MYKISPKNQINRKKVNYTKKTQRDCQFIEAKGGFDPVSIVSDLPTQF